MNDTEGTQVVQQRETLTEEEEIAIANQNEPGSVFVFDVNPSKAQHHSAFESWSTAPPKKRKAGKLVSSSFSENGANNNKCTRVLGYARTNRKQGGKDHQQATTSLLHSLGSQSTGSSKPSAAAIKYFTLSREYILSTYGECAAELQGEIYIADLLMRIFLFVPIDNRTVLALGKVSKGWREYSFALPHWQLDQGPSAVSFQPVISRAASSIGEWELSALKDQKKKKEAEKKKQQEIVSSSSSSTVSTKSNNSFHPPTNRDEFVVMAKDLAITKACIDRAAYMASASQDDPFGLNKKDSEEQKGPRSTGFRSWTLPAKVANFFSGMSS